MNAEQMGKLDALNARRLAECMPLIDQLVDKEADLLRRFLRKRVGLYVKEILDTQKMDEPRRTINAASMRSYLGDLTDEEAELAVNAYHLGVANSTELQRVVPEDDAKDLP